MEVGTLVKGTVNTAGLNVRDEPSGDVIAPSLRFGNSVEGEIVKDSAGGDWIKLSKANGSSVTGQYVAAWLCSLTAITPPAPTEPPQPKPIMVTSNITSDGKVIVTIEEPNNYDITVHVNGETYIKQP